MKNLRRFLVLALCSPLFNLAQAQQKLWYKQPAEVWTQALPLGNGKTGAMVFGKPDHELIQLNDATLWSGKPVATNVNPEAFSYLTQIRKAILEEKDYKKGYELTKKMQGFYSEAYMPLGDLLIDDAGSGAVNNYYRDLDIGKATATTRYTRNGVTYTRTAFISAPDQVMVIRITADKPGSISFTAKANSQLRYKILPAKEAYVLQGEAPVHAEPNYNHDKKQPIIYGDSADCGGMRFQLRMKALNTGGSVMTDTAGIHVRNANAVTLFLTTATSFNGYDKCPAKEGRDEKKLAEEQLQSAVARPYETLLQRHLADYQKYFKRVDFKLLNGDAKNAVLPTDERMIGYGKGAHDVDLESLYFQYGRYLLISSSRPGGQPANLQGIWNKEIRPPWSSNYTININTEMNYWPAEATNLSEMHEPLLRFLKDLSASGRITAKEFYHAKGWVAHHN
ncbi:MAG: glycoside hydrolase family 95 protein, partial [Mucilaginibacter polytrichastri]|nr:glycoside hydrolase family 95 protein [Mucilaginibacter polytrichastri]